MNDREQFEAWWNSSGYIGTEDTYRAFLAGAESKQSELNKANARIAQLEEALLWYVHNDDVSEGGKWEQENEYWLEGKRNAQKLLETSNITDTWLSDHDKAVEVRVLEEIEVELNNPWDGNSDTKCAHEAEMGILELIREMIEDRK
jgi:hypothetical protein